MSPRDKEFEAGMSGINGGCNYAFRLPRPLTLSEKKYLLSVERSDLASVRKILQAAVRNSACNPDEKKIDINCVDSLGRGALTLAIESENLEMLELLIVMGVETKDALLHAINQEFVEAVELLLEHEELLLRNSSKIDYTGTECNEIAGIHSWEKIDSSLARYPPSMTPLMLAAEKNNYEILKLLLDRGATLPMPHDIKCHCEDCLLATAADPLRLSSTRIAEYRALSSPSLIALSSPDPLMTAFQLSWELKDLASAEPESRAEYLGLRKQVEKFAVDLLNQTRTTSELTTVLSYDPDDLSPEPVNQLARLEEAIAYKQKKFVSHPHVQQLLASIWYEGVPGFRKMSTFQRAWILIKTALLFPFYCTIYFLFPNSRLGQTMRRPFMKFLVHASSYLFFLLILMLVSQRFEEEIVIWFGDGESIKDQIDTGPTKQRGLGPSFLECIVIIYVIGFIWEETREVYTSGLRAYLRNMWNFIDFTRNLLYVLIGVLRVIAYIQQSTEIYHDSSAAMIPREQWSDFDLQLIAEGLFAAANVLSALKLVHLFSINPHLGPLQISLGRMINDIVKFFFIYTLVLFAFACGLNQLLWYFAELERRKCYLGYEDQSTWDSASDACIRWRRFSNLFESCQSLFWASFGGVGIDSFELTGIKSYTRFWGLLMFGFYSVINVIVLLNLLIAMMSNSYAVIEEHSDTEWKFARTKLWMSYFEKGGTLPPPFNILPHPKLLLRICGLQKKSFTQSNNIHRQTQDLKYGVVMKALVWRYIVNAHEESESEPVTEDDIHELKADISAWRSELLDVFKRNGFDTDGTDKSEPILGKKMRVWERRLIKDFNLASPTEDPLEEINQLQNVPENEDMTAKWRRVARLAVLKSAKHRWSQVIDIAVKQSQIGKSNNCMSLKQQANLKRVMDEAKELVMNKPIPILTPIRLPEPVNPTSILKVLKDDDSCSHNNLKVEKSPIIRVKYEDERLYGKSAPGIGTRDLSTSPNRLMISNVQQQQVKRKSQAPPTPLTTAVNRSRSPSNWPNNTLSVQDNFSKSRTNISPARGKVPEVTVIPVSPKEPHRTRNVPERSRSPRITKARSPKKGWL